MPDRQYFVAVPVISFNGLGGPVVPVQFAASVFVVEFAPHAFAYVRLIAKRLAGGIHLLRAKLNARIAGIRREFHVDCQVKVHHFAVGPNKFVLWYIYRRMPHDGIVLHRPVLVLRSRPALEVFAVKKDGVHTRFENPSARLRRGGFLGVGIPCLDLLEHGGGPLWFFGGQIGVFTDIFIQPE